MILIKYQLDLKQFFIAMVTDINMNDSLTRHYITLSHSVNFYNCSLLRRVNTKICQVHSRVWGHMGGGPTLK